ncbi:hypothetical protein D3C86_1402430 [compost metagenome]
MRVAQGVEHRHGRCVGVAGGDGGIERTADFRDRRGVVDVARNLADVARRDGARAVDGDLVRRRAVRAGGRSTRSPDQGATGVARECVGRAAQRHRTVDRGRRHRIGQVNDFGVGVQVGHGRAGGAGLRRDVGGRHLQFNRVRTDCASRVTRQAVALGVDDVAVLVDQEFTVARIHDRAALVGQAEHALGAVDGNVVFAAAALHGTHRETLVDGGYFHAQAHARAGVDVGERRGGRLEADGAGVGNVVADDIQVLRSGIQAAQSLSEAHVFSR